MTSLRQKSHHDAMLVTMSEGVVRRTVTFLGDHPPAHVHLLGPGFKVSIEVATLKTKGRAESKAVVEAKAWIVANREFVMRIWAERGAKR